MAASTDLTFALTHAIAYLTQSLIGRYSATTIDLLHFTLERNLTKQYENNWFPAEPRRGAGRRCLTLSPTGVPPRTIYYACQSSRVEWSDWIRCLGGVEMHLFVDPGCVSVRIGKQTTTHIIWSGANAVAAAANPSHIAAEEEEELFNMINDELAAPTWMTPILNQFPAIPRTMITSPVDEAPSATSSSASHDSLLSVRSTHSRTSSRSSNSSSSRFSFDSVDSAETAATSVYHSRSNSSSSVGAPARKVASVDRTFLLPAAKLLATAPMDFDEELGALSPTTPPSHRRVHINVAKKEVTPYDGGKTTVLTGGVMLGPRATPVTPASPAFTFNSRKASSKKGTTTFRLSAPSARV